MLKLYFFVSVICVVGVQVSLQQKCHFQHFQNCILGLIRYAAENEMPYPGNEREINKLCKYFNETRNCLYNYSINCMTPFERTLCDFLVSSTAKKMRDFCNPDHELYKSNVRNCACITENYAGSTLCMRALLATIEILSETKPGERLATFCCAYTNFRSCFTTHYRKACNQEAMLLMDISSELPVSDIVVQTCNSYREAGGKCPDLPSANDVKGTYPKTFVGSLFEPFLVE